MTISVVIPVYNDPEGLRDTLEPLVDQDFDGKYEVLPVDNNSTDCTGEVIREFEEIYPNLVRGIEENEVQSSYAARNKGIEEAKGKIICFIDADMRAPKDYLSKIKKEYKKEERNCVGCNVSVTSNSKNVVSRYRASKGFNIRKLIENDGYIPTCALTVRKELVDEIGLFDERMFSGGDVVYGAKIKENGYDLYFAENIVLEHPARETFSDLVKKQKRVGKGLYQMRKYHSDLSASRSPLDIRNFLPPNPFGFGKKFRDWDKKPITEKVMYYKINYLLKLARNTAYLKKSTTNALLF